ncbi:hypothetical protein IWQ62_002925 [Dispira parvispora]|uniref:Uncharacterized protein n=1 Tax=Dispira parvispora TaxID=1520584 RepID=A0A9W8ANY4_9FUNG|nr:hypothetical protein IWQ62_002925 [Dispira parvispora]
MQPTTSHTVTAPCILEALADVANSLRPDLPGQVDPPTSTSSSSPLPSKPTVTLPPLSHLKLESTAEEEMDQAGAASMLSSGLPQPTTGKVDGPLPSLTLPSPHPLGGTQVGGHRKTHSMSIFSLLENSNGNGSPASRSPLTPTLERPPSQTQGSLHLKRPSQMDLQESYKSPRLPEVSSGERLRHLDPFFSRDRRSPPPAVAGNGTLVLPPPSSSSMSSHRRHQSWSVGQHQPKPQSTLPSLLPPLPLESAYGHLPSTASLPGAPYPPSHTAAPHSTQGGLTAAWRGTPSGSNGALTYPTGSNRGFTHYPSNKLRLNAVHTFIAYMIYSHERSIYSVPGGSGRRTHHSHSYSDLGVASSPGHDSRSQGAPMTASFYSGSGHSRSKTLSAFHSPFSSSADPSTPPLPRPNARYGLGPPISGQSPTSLPPLGSNGTLANTSSGSYHLRSVSHSGVPSFSNSHIPSQCQPSHTLPTSPLRPKDTTGSIPPLTGSRSFATGPGCDYKPSLATTHEGIHQLPPASKPHLHHSVYAMSSHTSFSTP